MSFARAAPLLSAVALAVGGVALAFNDGLKPVDGVDRETPLATVQGFFDAARAGDDEVAAHYLYLDHLPRQTQAAEGSRLARRLRFVLDRKLVIDYAKLSKAPQADAGVPGYELLGTLKLRRGQQTIRLQNVELDGGRGWVFSQDTVRAIDRLYDEFGPPFGARLPPFLYEHSLFSLELWQWLGVAAVLLFAGLFAWLFQRLFVAIGRRITRITNFTWDEQLVDAGRLPVYLPPWSLAVAAGTRSLLLPIGAQNVFDIVARSLLIASFAWFLLRALRVGSRFLETQLASTGVTGRTRSLRTQVAVMRRLAEVIIWVVAAALLLIQFEVVRNVGVSMLASAGLAGLVIGFAAQKSLGTLLAGIQLSITQPIRIGDNVVVEGQFGVIEEIHLTYVIVRVWDLRRLVVPITVFLDKTFENWSRGESLLGAVILLVDFMAKPSVLREELKRVLEEEGKALWDGKVGNLQVVDTSDTGVTLRLLVSASEPSKLWDLRVLLRERMIEFIQRKHPEWMPMRRTESRTRDGATPPS